MTRILSAALVALAYAAPAWAQDVFVDNGTIVTADRVRTTVDMLISDGRIEDIGTDLTAPVDAQIITGGWVTPGLVAPYSTLGLVDIGAEESANDTSSETSLISAAEMAADSFNPKAAHIANARRRGVTHAAIAMTPSGETIFGGMGLVASLSGEFDSVVDDRAFMLVDLGQRGSSRAGGTRSAAIAQLRGALDDAQAGYDGQDEGDVLRRRDAVALRPVLTGDMPLMIRAGRAADMLRIIDLLQDYPRLDLILVGAEEGHLIAGQLADNDIKVIVDPLQNLPQSFDALNASFDNVNVLDEAGVDYAISNLSALGVTKAGTLAQHAGNAVGHGLSRQAAFEAITATPARWFGIDQGRIATGASATLIVWDGDPFEVTSAPVAMMIDGEAVSLESRMTRLRDRYNPLNEDQRPHKYR